MMKRQEKTMGLTRVEHSFLPVYDKNSRILILGSMPSVKSRENNFYYGHPRNRFWKVIATLTGSSMVNTIEEKTAMLLKNRIAVWDVIKSCDIYGSSDSSITNVEAADIRSVLTDSNIERIYANGGKAFELYNKYCLHNTGVEISLLPSTSPANASYSLERLINAWSEILW